MGVRIRTALTALAIQRQVAERLSKQSPAIALAAIDPISYRNTTSHRHINPHELEIVRQFYQLMDLDPKNAAYQKSGGADPQNLLLRLKEKIKESSEAGDPELPSRQETSHKEYQSLTHEIARVSHFHEQKLDIMTDQKGLLAHDPSKLIFKEAKDLSMLIDGETDGFDLSHPLIEDEASNTAAQPKIRINDDQKTIPLQDQQPVPLDAPPQDLTYYRQFLDSFEISNPSRFANRASQPTFDQALRPLPNLVLQEAIRDAVAALTNDRIAPSSSHSARTSEEHWNLLLSLIEV